MLVEAKKMEIDRFVRAVQDPEVRESLHSRKLAPDFARQQKDIRHTYQVQPFRSYANCRKRKRNFEILLLH